MSAVAAAMREGGAGADGEEPMRRLSSSRMTQLASATSEVEREARRTSRARTVPS